MSANKEQDGRRKLVVAVAVLVVLLAVAWWFGAGSRDSGDPQVAELLQAMQQPAKFDWPLLKQRYEKLSPQQQQEFNRAKMIATQPQHEQELRAFFAQSEAVQREQLDRKIDAAEAAHPKAGGGGEKGREGLDPQQIMAGKRQWTANASPELRSLMDRYVRMMRQRRAQRGLAP